MRSTTIVPAVAAWLLATAAVGAGPAVVGRMPLAAADLADTIEAPSVAFDAAGRLHVAWVSETTPGERTVFVATAPAGGALGPPRVVARSGVFVAESTVPGRDSPPRQVRRALRTAPHVGVVPAPGGTDQVVVVFTAARPDDADSVRPLVARSVDGGATFSAPAPLAGMRAERPTFSGCACGPDGIAFSWLDHRLGVQVPAVAAAGPPGDAFAAETLLEETVGPRGVCPCCPTAVAWDGPGRVLLAFRNHRDGYRDMHVARLERGSGRFDAVAAVVPPSWKFEGCPHDGPALAVRDARVTVAWMDAHEGGPAVYVADGSTQPLAFSAARRLDPAAAGGQGNPRLAHGASGALHAVWERGSAARGAAPAPALEAPGRRGSGPDAAHGHDPAAGGRLVVHAIRRGGTWTEPQPLVDTVGVLQTRPALAAGAAGELAAAFFERDDAGKALVVVRLAAAAGATRGPVAGTASARRPAVPGRLAYLQYCAGCHGAAGHGDGPVAAVLPQPPRDLAAAAWRGERSRAGIRRAITSGVPGTPMKAVSELPPAEVAAVVDYVAALAGLGPEAATGGSGAALVRHDPPLPPPAFTLDGTDGERWAPGDGTATVVHVWGTSCAACLAEAPRIEALARSLPAGRLRVVHLCVDAADVTEAQRLLDDAAPGARAFVDPTGRAADRLGARLLPATRLLDGVGRIVAALDGAADADAEPLRAAVEALVLPGRPPSAAADRVE